jgi:hypothetical protein
MRESRSVHTKDHQAERGDEGSDHPLIGKNARSKNRLMDTAGKEWVDKLECSQSSKRLEKI